MAEEINNIKIDESKPWNLFISWHDDKEGKSKAIALELREFIMHVVPGFNVFCSASISSGEWSAEVDLAFNQCNFAIFLLMDNAIQSHWITFECGAFYMKALLAAENDEAKRTELMRQYVVFDIQKSSSGVTSPIKKLQVVQINDTANVKVYFERMATFAKASGWEIRFENDFATFQDNRRGLYEKDSNYKIKPYGVKKQELKTPSSRRLSCGILSKYQGESFIPRDKDVEKILESVKRHKVVNITGIGGCGKSTISVLYLAGNKSQKSKYAAGFKNNFNEVTDIIINAEFPDNVYKEFCVRFIDKMGIGEYVKANNREDGQPDYVKSLDNVFNIFRDIREKDGKPNLLVVDVNETADYSTVTQIINEFVKVAEDWKVLVVSREQLCDSKSGYVDITKVDDVDKEFIRELFVSTLNSTTKVWYEDLPNIEKIFVKLGNLPILIKALAEFLNDEERMTEDNIIEILGDGDLTQQILDFKCSGLNKEDLKEGLYDTIGNFFGNLNKFDKLNHIQKKIVKTMMLWDADYYSRKFIYYMVEGNDGTIPQEFKNALSELVNKCWLDTRRSEDNALTFKMHSLIAKNSIKQVFNLEKGNEYRDFTAYLENIKSISKLENKERQALNSSLSRFDITFDDEYLLKQAHDFSSSEIYEKALKIKCLKLDNCTSEEEISGRLKKMKASADRIYYLWLDTQQDYSNNIANNKSKDPVINKYINCDKFKRVPQGSFKREGYEVRISNDFYLGETQVTQELWQAVMGDNPSLSNRGDKFPVENVSWYDCLAFIMKLNKETHLRFRLPMEAEWEYAAGMGKNGRRNYFSGCNSEWELKKYAWYDDNSFGKTHEVATRLPNDLGIYDMSGNVWEWCQDWVGNYPSENITDFTGPTSGASRILRGGSWNRSACFCRVSFRNFTDPGDRCGSIVGFRLLLSRPK